MANLSELSPTPQILGSGLAQMAGSKLQIGNLYKKYVIDAQSSGEEPMSIEEFAKTLNG